MAGGILSEHFQKEYFSVKLIKAKKIQFRYEKRCWVLSVVISEYGMNRFFIFLLVSGIVCLGGCVPPLIDLSDLTDNASEEEKQIEVYEGKVYLIGTLTGTLKEEFDAAMTFTDYTDGATDGAIVISADAFGSLTQAQLDGFAAAFAAHQPIILVQATADQITDFVQQILGDSYSFNLPYGFEYAEVYAIDMEEGDDIWQWSLYPPDVTDDEDTAEEQQDRLGDLVDWLQENSTRMTQASAENAKAAAAAAAGSNDLIQLASAFVNQSNFRKAGVDCQVTHFIYSCHSLATGYDWFYVQQQCVFNAGGAWQGKATDFWGPNAWWYSERVQWYIDKIDIDSTMNGYDYNSTDVGMIQSSPATANNVQSVTSGVDFSIGGDVGVDKSGPSATVSGGVTISSSRTINIQDCQVVNKSNDRSNNAHWVYQFNRCSAIGYFLYAGVTDPPSLAINTFQPVNQWIWHMSSKLRENNVPIHVSVNIDLCSSAGILYYYWIANIKHTTTSAGQWEYNLYIPYPPKTTD
jgi:hypothetical protein